jgi:hypothetical protein
MGRWPILSSVFCVEYSWGWGDSCLVSDVQFVLSICCDFVSPT